MNKKIIILGLLTVSLTISIAIGFSYALWTQTEKQGTANVVQSGCFSITLSGEDDINIPNGYPISDEKGKEQTPYKFTITNTCSIYASYTVNLEKLTGSTMDSLYVKVMLDNNESKLYSEYKPDAVPTDGASESKTLTTGGLNPQSSITYELRLWIDYSGTNDTVGGKTFNSRIVVSAAATEKPPTGADYIESLLATNSDTMKNDDPDKNVRYIGSTPDNYVTFNGEIWRIIGVFNHMWECPEDTEGKSITTTNYTTECKQVNLLKIIRDEALSTFSWDSTSTSTNGGYGVNEWSTSAIQKALNGAYYNSQVGTCYGGYNLSSKTCDFTVETHNPTKGLDATARNQVARVMWNTGTLDKELSTATAQTFYTAERSDNNGKICPSGTYCNDQTSRTTKWIGKVGLMYPSDYGYATSGGTSKNRDACLNYQLYNWDSSSFSDCKNTDWLFNSAYQWTMTPVPKSSDANRAFAVFTSGLVGDYGASYAGGVRPVVYLKSDVQITGGKGTSNEPYTLT